jgi:hypothetical protein
VGVEGSNREILQRLFFGSEGVDMAPILRAWLDGHTEALTPEQAAGGGRLGGPA